MKIIAIFLALLLTSCKEDEVYTLYRASPLDVNMRIHIASFDAKDGESYNHENCEIAKDLFIQQPSVTVKYWCEKGEFKE